MNVATLESRKAAIDYFVAYAQRDGKSGLLPVRVGPYSGAELRDQKDVRDAIQACADAGFEPTGSVFSVDAVRNAADEALVVEAVTGDYLSHLDAVYDSIETAESYRQRHSEQMDSSVEEHYSRIGAAVSRYVSDVLPHRSLTGFSRVANIQLPAMRRVLMCLTLKGDQRGVRWSSMARSLEAMGILGPVTRLIETYVDRLLKLRDEEGKAQDTLQRGSNEQI